MYDEEIKRAEKARFRRRKMRMIKQLMEIDELFYVEDEPLPQDSNTNELFYKALYAFRHAQLDTGLGSGRDPLYEEGTKYMEEAYKIGDLNALRLKLYVATGSSIKVEQDWEKIEPLYRELYERTNDPEIEPILANMKKHISHLLHAYMDLLYYARCAELEERKRRKPMASSPTYSGSHDESYYDNLTCCASSNKIK